MEEYSKATEVQANYPEASECAAWSAMLTNDEIAQLADGERPYMIRPDEFSWVACWPKDAGEAD